MTKNNVKPIVVLTVICLAVGLLLAGVNMLTRGKIAENELLKEQASLIEVLPSEVGFDLIETTPEMPETVSSVYKEKAGGGYVFILKTTTQYSKGDIVITVGIKNGVVVGVKLTAYYDSKNLDKDYPDKFVGKDIDTFGKVEHIVGVSYSSKAFRAAIGDALIAEALLNSDEPLVMAPAEAAPLSAKSTNLPKTDAELASLISTLTGGKEVAEITLAQNAPETLKKLYSVQGGGEVAYIVVAGEYVPVATEALVLVNANAEVENINLLSWVVGHGVGAGDFANGFIGKDTYTVDGTDLVSGATGTSKDFRDALSLALSYITDDLGVREARFNNFVLSFAGSEITEVADLTGAPATLKRLYTVKDGGAVAYIVVPGAYVPVATEALVYINSRGVIENVNLMSWIVGHGVGPDKFADEFLGKSYYNIGDVELVSGATGTSRDFYNNVNEALLFVTDMIYSRDKVILDFADAMIPNSSEVVKVELPTDAPKTLVALYKDLGGQGSVAHIIVPGAYVPVATEAWVAFDQFGTIRAVDLRAWIVGHGVEPGDFADRFVGKNAETLSDVELVSAATGTSQDFRDALVAAMPFIPTEFPIFRIVGIIAIIALVGGIVAYTVYTKRRRAVK